MTSTRPTAPGERYRPAERLGGRENPVHRAHDLLLQRDVVIKSFPGADGTARWEHDALRRVQLGPGQAMEVLDGAPDGADGPFVVMPVARGGSLDRALDPWDPTSAALLVARLAVGLGRLHRLGLVHGGVGPDAVLLDPTLGPRWTGLGAAVADTASAEDDVLALAGIAVTAVTGPAPAAVAPSGEVVEAVRALVVAPGDTGARARLRAALAAHTARHGIAPRAARGLPVARPPRRARRAVLAACVGAAVVGGVLGAGFATTGGDASATVVAGTIEEPAVDLTPPAAVLAVPTPGSSGLIVGPAGPAPTGAAADADADDDVARPSSGGADRPATRSGDRPAAEARAADRRDDAPERADRGDRDRDSDRDRAEDRDEDRQGDGDRRSARDGDRDGGDRGHDRGGDADDDGGGSRSDDGDDGGAIGRMLDDTV
ncbi:hypothetical protein [Actinomycetospora straminea]|uniref:Protein kinase domain-containing protein n=1 Tax=Actinomycetospora straminea TaxID=663607 RepID=A0ABP9FBM4_9PSEU|nr:hypothetical protein [Actinomycetospora straminea]MDD7936082.1 hypothetical protein [Actinomycetospora straminea]